MWNSYNRFGLAQRMRNRKFLVIIFSIIIGVVATVSIAKVIIDRVNAITGDGAAVKVGYVTDDSGNPHMPCFGSCTHIFNIKIASGDSERGFCLNPGDLTPGENQTADRITSDSEKNKMLKLAVYIATRRNDTTDVFWDQWFNSAEQSGNKAYAAMHRVIGYIQDNDSLSYQLSADEKVRVLNIVSTLNSLVQGSEVWAMAKDFQLYRLNPNGLSSGQQNIIWIENNRRYANIAIQKCDTINPVKSDKTCNASGSADFSGVSFRVKYVGNEMIYDARTKKFYERNSIVATGKTNNAGRLSFSNLPLGEYVVEEYDYDGGPLVFREAMQEATLSSNGATITLVFKNPIKRGDVKFRKVDEKTGNVMANVPFRITSRTTQESHIVVTDSNGVVNTSTSANAHSNHTNGYDGSASDPNSITYKGYGTWFGMDGNAASPVDDNVGALPYDTYDIVEIACNQNQFCYDISSQKKTVNIRSNMVVEDLGDWKNDCVEFELETVAYDNADGDKVVEAKSGAEIRDEIEYTVMKGQEFTIKGVLMDDVTRQPVKVNGTPVEKSVTVRSDTEEHGHTSMVFSFDATAYKGHRVVVFEYIYSGNQLVKSHADYEYNEQAVDIYSLDTRATDPIDDNDSIVAKQDQKIKDTIDYCFKSGKTFTIKGILKDKATGENVLVGGQTVEQSVVVTPTSNCGQTAIVYDIDASELAGRELVVFEYAYEGTDITESSTPVITHEDINDDKQSIWVFSLGTVAVDGISENKSVTAEEDRKVKDTINYCLKAGTTYTIKGILMDKETGEGVVINGETVEQSVVITPESNCGQTVVVFDINAKDLAGKKVVAFEYAYEGDEVTEESKPVVTHEEINDPDQTVSVVKVTTDARDAADGDKKLLAEEKAAIVDKISYCLNAGEEYVIKGILMDKSTGNPFPIEGQFVENSITFTPEADCGEIEMTFEFNAVHLAGAQIVVFESVFQGDKLIVAHKDIDDDAQTIDIYPPTPDTGLFSVPEVGATNDGQGGMNWLSTVAIVSVVVVMGALGSRVISRRRFMGRMK